jgi:hypothetical protein
MARHFGPHAMIGEGGRVRVPRSESETLRSIGNMLATVNGTQSDQVTLRRIRDMVDALEEQVKEGYHRNPSSSRLYEPFKVVGLIGKHVDSIAYIHAQKNKPYKHDFEGQAEIVAIERHGKRELLITSPQGVPLWDEF